MELVNYIFEEFRYKIKNTKYKREKWVLDWSTPA